MSRPTDIPSDIWDAADGTTNRISGELVKALTEGSEATADGLIQAHVARAIMAERARWQPAVAYFNAYCLDEAESAEDCIGGLEQHDAAKALGAVVRGEA